jgi:hypothetical protein
MRITSFASIGALGLACLLVAGCGGSSSSSSRSSSSSPSAAVTPAHAATEKSHATPAESNADIGQAGAQQPARSSRSTGAGSGNAAGGSRTHHGDIISKTHVQQAKTQAANDDTVGVSAAPNPCRLVSLSEAQSIAGSGIRTRVEAPLGPTCIYRGAHATSGITVAVQSRSFTAAAHQLTKRKTLVVSGRTAYCGQLGTPMLLVPLSGGEVLNVSAPCGLAQRFAARALQRLAA